MSRQPGQKSCKNGPFWGASMTTKQFEHVYFFGKQFPCSRVAEKVETRVVWIPCLWSHPLDFFPLSAGHGLVTRSQRLLKHAQTIWVLRCSWADREMVSPHGPDRQPYCHTNVTSQSIRTKLCATIACQYSVGVAVGATSHWHPYRHPKCHYPLLVNPF